MKIKTSKQNDGEFMLTYKIKGSDGNKVFYLKVTPDGKATLQTPPTKEETTILSGYIINVLDAG